MEYEPGEYQRLDIRQFPARTLRETAEGKYWRRFKAPVVAKHFGPVSYLDFCPTYPYNLAVTASTRVITYNGLSRGVARTFSRFKDTAYSGSYRVDGKLLVAGGQDGMVQVFDAGSRGVLRQFKAHKRPTHVARFSPDKLHVLSGSDDVTVRWWDVTAGAQLARFDGHSDYVRAAACSPANIETWATGGYDHVVKLWDVRQKGSAACVMDVDHGAPVEDVTFFPSGSLLVTAGGNTVCVWDIVGGGRLLKKLSNFQKTVTAVKLSSSAGPESMAAPRLLTGSLDGHVKVIELDNFKVTHASKYPQPVLSLGISPDCSMLAVGMADGTLSMRRHDRPRTITTGVSVAPAQKQRFKPRLTAANYRYFIRGQNERAAAGDFRVAARRKARLQPYDHMLRQFRHRDALSAALETRRPEVIVSVIEELAARGPHALSSALGGRDAGSLVPLIKFLCRAVGEPRHTKLVCNVAHRLLDIYAGVVGLSPEVDARLVALRDRVGEELALHGALAEIAGCLEPILSASLASLSLQPAA